jgi:hypothetical protein
MKNQHIKSKDEVPSELRLEIYKQALTRNWKTNVDGLCHILTMYLWGFSYEDEAYRIVGHKFWHTKDMFPELVAELPKIGRALDKNNVRINSLKRMIKKIETKN